MAIWTDYNITRKEYFEWRNMWALTCQSLRKSGYDLSKIKLTKEKRNDNTLEDSRNYK